MTKKIFSFLLLVVFIAEMAVMGMLAPLFAQLPPVGAALVDAGILVLMFVPPLALLCYRIPDEDQRVKAGRLFRVIGIGLFCKLLAMVFAVEFVIMFLMTTLLPEISGLGVALLDAGLTILLLVPALRWVLSRSLEQFPQKPLENILNAPIILYFSLLYLIFLTDLLQESLQPSLTPVWLEPYTILFDAVLTTLIVAPFIFIVMGRPLIRAAKAERTRTKTILDQVVDAVVTLDSKGRILALNPAAQKMFGFSAEKLSGQPIDVLFTDAQATFHKLISARSGSASDSPTLVQRELNCRNAYGSQLIADVSLSRIRQQEQDEWLLILHDISLHKETERALRERDERFRQIFEQADDAIVFFKPNSCKVIDVNATFTRLFGYSKAELLTREFESLLSSDDRAAVSSTISNSAQGVTARLDNFLGRQRDGTPINLSMQSKLMTIDDISIVFASFRDITNRIRLEAEAKEIQAKLIQANKMTSLGLMVSGVAHEINNPNNFIMSNSRLLADTWQDNRKVLYAYYQEHGDFCLGGIPFSELDDHVPRLFAGIHDGATRINGIVNNLKNFYRPHRSSAGPVDLNQVATSTVSLIHHELVHFTNNFQLTLMDGLPPVNGNGQQLGQVMINLVMNACQALPDKNRGIWLETGYDRSAAQVTLTVRDEGLGMSPEDSRKVMEPFFTTKLDEGGTGLGLTICKSIIMEHQGTLEFDSKPGKGSTFVVKLPAAASTGEE